VTETFRCADASEARSEPMFATASYVRDWLLVEQPGGWGFNAATQSRMATEVGAALVVHARAEGVRLILIKRGTRFASPKPHAYACHVSPHSAWLERLDIDKPEDLLDVDLSAVREDRGGLGETVSEPIYLVCTHGRHDACCSIKGNPVSRLLCATYPGRGWEASHIGGDRFAANIVCLPAGAYLGRVRVEEVARLTGDLEAGRVDLAHYRGRCCYPFAIQAGEYFVRVETNIRELNDVVLVRAERVDAATLLATFDAVGRPVTVRVRASADPSSYRLTCKAERSHSSPRYELLSIQQG
jgi:hypothetical protein